MSDPTIPEALHTVLRWVAEEVIAGGVVDPPEQPDPGENRLSYPVGHSVAIEVERLDDDLLYVTFRAWAPDHDLVADEPYGEPTASAIEAAALAVAAIKEYHAEQARLEAQMAEGEFEQRLADVLADSRNEVD